MWTLPCSLIDLWASSRLCKSGGWWKTNDCCMFNQSCIFCVFMIYCFSLNMWRIMDDARIHSECFLCVFCLTKWDCMSSITKAFKPYKMFMSPSKTFKLHIMFKLLMSCGCCKITFHFADCLYCSKVKSQMVKEKEDNLGKLWLACKSTVSKLVQLLRLRKNSMTFVLVLIRRVFYN